MRLKDGLYVWDIVVLVLFVAEGALVQGLEYRINFWYTPERAKRAFVSIICISSWNWAL